MRTTDQALSPRAMSGAVWVAYSAVYAVHSEGSLIFTSAPPALNLRNELWDGAFTPRPTTQGDCESASLGYLQGYLLAGSATIGKFAAIGYASRR